jgi:hypothetical protein
MLETKLVQLKISNKNGLFKEMTDFKSVNLNGRTDIKTS